MAATDKLTAEQFDALATLLRMRDSAPREGARLVLVEGLALSDAARASGAERQNVHRAVAACRRGLELARQAAG